MKTIYGRYLVVSFFIENFSEHLQKFYAVWDGGRQRVDRWASMLYDHVLLKCEEHNMSHWHLMGINFVSTSSNSKYFQLLFSNFKTIIGKGYCIACNTKFPRTNYTAMEELRILTFSSDAINCRAFPKESGRKTKTKNRYGTRRFSLSYLDTLLGPYSVQGLGKS